MAHILDVLREQVLLCDGAIGTAVHSCALDLARDFQNKENCTEVLNLSRPDVIRDIHLGHFRAGADLVQTNSFGASPITLAEFGLADQAAAINRRAAEIAREALGLCGGDGRDRFVIGSIGPGTRLPSLGHIAYQALEDALAVQSAGLVAGGVDAILIETCQDPLQIKAAVNGAKRARAESRQDIPIFVQVTVETTGTLLTGPDIAAAATVIEALDVPLLGLNCGTGPREMAEHLKWLSENWPGMISVQPNAGLPELIDGHTHYPLTADGMAPWIERFVREDGVNLVGGCCGTETGHIAALDAMLRRLAGDGRRPRPKDRRAVWQPSIASLYGQTPLRQENAYLSVGERCNANGSRQFRECQEKGDWDGAVAIAKDQLRHGSHAIDVCTAYVGRDEVAEMSAAITNFAGAVAAPLSIDSTELPVLEAALKLYGGKAIINSIHLEDGEESLKKRVALAKRFGAAVIALTIDEQGMAKAAPQKLALARRIHDLACGEMGLRPSDILFDPLTFTICTGNEDDRRLGVETLDGIGLIAEALPESQIILGLSNISFGLLPAARNVLNSVFLDEALKRGMSAAILHVSKIVPLHKIPEAEAQTALDLIYDRRRPGYDPLHAFIALFQDRTEAKAAKKERPASVEERLKQRIIDGDRPGLEDDLRLALETYAPLLIINDILLAGMKVVGDLFGAGKMQLPFVLQSAETMKASVAFLEPFMERADGSQKGTIVLATVKGDVHDIGKNLVDILLTNNGFKVVNLGIKQPLGPILEAAESHRAHAVGLSGLLVKSTVVMRENLEEMSRLGLRLPVILGGAALTRRYVDEDCAKAYATGAVAYARDAFEGLSLMNKVVNGTFADDLAVQREARRGRPVNDRRKLGVAVDAKPLRPLDLEEIRLRRNELTRYLPVPKPPFWGARTIARVPLKTVSPYLNERMLFQFHWGYRKDGRTLDEFKAWAKTELRPVLNPLLERVARENILLPQAAYGYWPCAASGNDVIVFDADAKTELARFSFPRQAKEGGLCIADFFRDVTDNERDVIALQVVTMGKRASDVAREWFAADRYKDYLYLHGLSVEMAEALAEYLHQRIRAELGFAGEEARDLDGLLQQHYRGSRYSFGYPACPDLAQQRQLLRLLRAEEIGITLTEEDQLDPEQSTSALVAIHPQAKYFTV
ncbi:MAG TPA: methionine synthase [Stellaceae bacterium]|nr:methionine synthase [Stellaceae bacterium]